jgi:hypothetical protein
MQVFKASSPNHKHHQHKPISLATFCYDPGRLAQSCLTATHNDPASAVTLAAKFAHGSRLRETIAAIATVVLNKGTTP